MALYREDSIPQTTTWIKGLSAIQATEQCVAWSIKPAATLEENRVLLKNFVKAHKGKSDDEESVGNLASQPLEPSITVTPTVPPPNTNDNDSSTPTGTTQPAEQQLPSSFPDQNVKLLLESMHQLTMNAVTETARIVAREIQSGASSRSQPPDDTTVSPYVRDLIKNIPKLTSNDHDQIFNFLKRVYKLMKLKLTSERALLLNLGALVQNTLHEYWMDKVANHVTGEQLLLGILKTFFTPDTLRELQNKYLYRPQDIHEDLADYVKDIQFNYKILSSQTPEKDIFNVIFRGINSQTRISFAGLPPVSSIQELIDIAPLSASLVPHPTPPHNWNNSFSPRNQFATNNRYYSEPSPSNNYQHRSSNFTPSYSQSRNFHPNQNRYFPPGNLPPGNHQRQYTPYHNNPRGNNNIRYHSPNQPNTYRSDHHQPNHLNARRGAR